MVMKLFFDEDGAFKAGTVLSETGNAYQVELLTGRRTKIKSSHTFFTFESPSAQELMDAAQRMASELDPAFLWEFAPDEEFDYEALAQEYFGENLQAPQRAAMLMALHENPVYFYRKGRGHYKRAPKDILDRALQALERKRQQELLRQQWVEQMLRGELPEALAPHVLTLLVRPDKNSIEWKAINDAASEARKSVLQLMLDIGGIASPWRWHVDSFYLQNFPKGRQFPEGLPEPDTQFWETLPRANVEAFSIDDSNTTEIDDAVSVQHLENGKTVVGVHIAAPAFGIHRDDALDQVARRRMSTLYAPGLKTTMLPENWIQAFSLDEGKEVPCLSLYMTVDDATLSIEKSETRLERIAVSRNLRYDKIDELVTEEAIRSGTLPLEFGEEMSWLWFFAKRLLADREAVRGRPEVMGRVDWYFALEGEGEDAEIHVLGRRRGEPLDLLVAELMIVANKIWGLWLEEHQAAGIYRCQRMGRVRMTTVPGPHDGLGVVRYAWCTSPLRRYVDLINQRQMINVVMGNDPVYANNEQALHEIVSEFDTIYTTYNDFQTRMDRYWSLRWIMQEGLKQLEAIVVKGDLVRIDGLPFMQRVPGLPEDLPRGRKVLLLVQNCDLVNLVLEASLIKVLDETDALAQVEEDVVETESDAESEQSNPSPTASSETTLTSEDESVDSPLAGHVDETQT